MRCHSTSAGIPTINVATDGKDLGLSYTDRAGATRFLSDTATPLWDIFWRDIKTWLQKLHTRIFLFMKSKLGKYYKYSSVGKWINKLWSIHHYLAIKMNEWLIPASNRLIQALASFTFFAKFCDWNQCIHGNYSSLWARIQENLKMSYIS